MTEEFFYKKIKEETGFDVNDPSTGKFGFITGVCHPFVDLKSIASAHYSPYFTVFKEVNSVNSEKHIYCNNSETMLKEVIEFLKDK